MTCLRFLLAFRPKIYGMLTRILLKQISDDPGSYSACKCVLHMITVADNLTLFSLAMASNNKKVCAIFGWCNFTPCVQNQHH